MAANQTTESTNQDLEQDKETSCKGRDQNETDIQKYKCTKCRRLFQETPWQNYCEHRFCSECSKHYRVSHDLCPSCSDDGVTEKVGTKMFFPDVAFGRQIRNLRAKCSYGCNWEGEFSRLSEHQNSCAYRKTNCTACNQLVYRLDLERHQTVQCRRRKVTCHHCQAIVPFTDIIDHERNRCPVYPDVYLRHILTEDRVKGLLLLQRTIWKRADLGNARVEPVFHPERGILQEEHQAPLDDLEKAEMEPESLDGKVAWKTGEMEERREEVETGEHLERSEEDDANSIRQQSRESDERMRGSGKSNEEIDRGSGHGEDTESHYEEGAIGDQQDMKKLNEEGTECNHVTTANRNVFLISERNRKMNEEKDINTDANQMVTSQRQEEQEMITRKKKKVPTATLR